MSYKSILRPKSADTITRPYINNYTTSYINSLLGSSAYSSLLNTETSNFKKPLMDMVESNGRVHISIDMPGLSIKDISVTLSDNMLYIKAEKNMFTQNNQNEVIYTSERLNKNWSRYVRLPINANTKLLSATYKNGVLFIQAPINKYSNIERTIPVTQG
tara:strand:- start:2239 stop:2715 length:477 start_codon:yes stop_codon:yes gene_type:complete